MGMIGYLKRVPAELLTALIQKTATLDEYVFGDEAGEELDLDKAWHGLHYLLCGEAFGGEEPLYNALMGGRPINEEETEDIIVRYLTPDQVREVSAALEALDDDALSKGFAPDDMNEAGVYPAPDWNDAGELDYLLGYYGPMKQYYRQAAENGEGMLIYVS